MKSIPTYEEWFGGYQEYKKKLRKKKLKRILNEKLWVGGQQK